MFGCRFASKTDIAPRHAIYFYTQNPKEVHYFDLEVVFYHGVRYYEAVMFKRGKVVFDATPRLV